ncbi:Starch-binding associating with outer membrane [Mucilaginibacter pineti]|uniref:Starch-binding associating with outer membrane n=1 Tax=Mucilaginibacter pineti TaxID=1391627 RepID=A0A1G7HCH1_9SPHI|nr:RagB/SusD family nutrient uptake outer membrane protein [Mucilaginibacter pineti]SDE98003.1 Starch-binding associating with outer membrane [Mucilaginibacter pineti]
MKKLYIILLCLCPVLAISSSCKKFVQIDAPKNQIISDKVFADSTDVNAAVLGIYINMMQAFGLSFSSGGVTTYPALSSDEIYQSTTDINSQFYANNISNTNDTNTALWTLAYNFIYGTNACIEGIEAGTAMSSSQKNILCAEAKCIRAFLYFNLVNLYGPVPLAITTDYNINRLLSRSSADLVYSQIIADLKFAQANLLSSSTISERANYYAATALLAKVYLYRGEYALAKIESDKIINSGQFQLMADLNSVFLATSKETIWRFIPVFPGRETWEAYFFVPSSTTTTPKYILTNKLFSSFETNDLRKSKWVNINIVSGQSYPYPYKYKRTSATSPRTESYVILRFAEQYLIRAEAEANLDNLIGAITDLNMIRNRAGLPNTTASDKTTILLAIENERQAELFCEGGNRWFDLKRTNRANKILSSEKANWKPSAALYPIPQTEINADPNLTQNIGY